jgi:molecular chaperone GrpE
MNKHSNDEDVNFEPEEDLGDIGAAQAKLRKLKDELTKIKTERQEYLDGWQRCKADSVNAKRDADARSARSAEHLREELVHDIIPALDSFDMAAGSDAWMEIEDGWRSGMELVRDQLIDALKRNGIERYGKIGEVYNPHVHDVVQEVEDAAGEPHTIFKVVRYGYKVGDRVLRPVQVITKK